VSREEAVRARVEAAAASTRGTELIRVRQGRHGINDRGTAELWAQGQDWYDRVVWTRYERGWWLWRVVPAEKTAPRAAQRATQRVVESRAATTTGGVGER
jgi:hypothetical protein